MATPTYKRILDKEHRELAKALTDLSKIFTQKDLAKRFKLKPAQIRYYKRYRKVKPLAKRKRTPIISFYQKLLAKEKGEDRRYHYRVVRKRIKLAPVLFQRKTLELLKSPEIKKLAKKEKVSPETILAKKLKVSRQIIKKWAKRDVRRLKKESRQKLFRAYQKIARRLVGLFSIQREFETKWGRRMVYRSYREIVYHSYFLGSEESFKAHIYEIEYAVKVILDSFVG